MSTEIMENGRQLSNGVVPSRYQPFQLAEADITGRPTVLLMLGRMRTGSAICWARGSNPLSDSSSCLPIGRRGNLC